MSRLRLLAVGLFAAVLFAAGCFSDADRRQWGEAFRDLRGDNMEFGSHSAQAP